MDDMRAYKMSRKRTNVHIYNPIHTKFPEKIFGVHHDFDYQVNEQTDNQSKPSQVSEEK